ncbi:hypothetical protein CK203_061949 [Vitis vinifera]|uniref:Retrotransposon gag domain-containing protein n=1 Tax=Vitis vinifera TaxID=29760 RepID=A0A438GF45_VITVI|nr:hypothetical protein CK203_061949 [Vitis vinifera]
MAQARKLQIGFGKCCGSILGLGLGSLQPTTNPYGFLVVKGRNLGGSNAERGMSIKGERIGEQKTFWHLGERGYFVGEKNRRWGASSELRAWRKATASWFLEVIISVHGSYLAEILRLYCLGVDNKGHTCLLLIGYEWLRIIVVPVENQFNVLMEDFRALVSHLEGLSHCLISVSMGNFEVMGGVVSMSLVRFRLARDHRYASLALRLARDHSESCRSGGSGEGPQIGDSTGDRTQNLWFHKRIKLELELGLLIEIDLGSRAWIRIGNRLVRGSDSSSQLEQIPDHRDMDPQYATIDQLAEITDTMASLRDAILGLVAALPVEFRMPDIERYTGIGCPRIHLQLYSTVMRGHRLDEAQMIMLFPLSLSGAAQRWFASLDPSRCRTWADLGQEFIRQYSFNTIVDVSRRELEALRQGPDETVTSFISRWREKIT